MYRESTPSSPVLEKPNNQSGGDLKSYDSTKLWYNLAKQKALEEAHTEEAQKMGDSTEPPLPTGTNVPESQVNLVIVASSVFFEIYKNAGKFSSRGEDKEVTESPIS